MDSNPDRTLVGDLHLCNQLHVDNEDSIGPGPVARHARKVKVVGSNPAWSASLSSGSGPCSKQCECKYFKFTFVGATPYH